MVVPAPELGPSSLFPPDSTLASHWHHVMTFQVVDMLPIRVQVGKAVLDPARAEQVKEGDQWPEMWRVNSPTGTAFR